MWLVVVCPGPRIIIMEILAHIPPSQKADQISNLEMIKSSQKYFPFRVLYIMLDSIELEDLAEAEAK